MQTNFQSVAITNAKTSPARGKRGDVAHTGIPWTTRHTNPVNPGYGGGQGGRFGLNRAQMAKTAEFCRLGGVTASTAAFKGWKGCHNALLYPLQDLGVIKFGFLGLSERVEGSDLLGVQPPPPYPRHVNVQGMCR